jgi:hypothetical protein
MPDPNWKVLEAKVIQSGPGHGVTVTYEGNKIEEYYIGTKEDAEDEVRLLLSGKKFCKRSFRRTYAVERGDGMRCPPWARPSPSSCTSR